MKRGVEAAKQVLRRPEAALFCLVLVAYAFFYQAGGWNQNSRFDLTRSIVERGKHDIDPYHENTGDKAKRGEHYYTDKAPGASWWGVPVHLVAWKFGGSDSPRVLTASSYLVTLWVCGLPTAVSVVVLAWLAGRWGLPPWARVGLALAYGLGTLMFPFATLLYGHQLAGALLLCGFALLRPGEEKAPTPNQLVASGLLVGAAVAADYPAFLAVPILGAYLGLRTRSWRRLTWFALGLAGPGLAVAAYHTTQFGGPFTVAYTFSTNPEWRMESKFGLPGLDAWWGITFSPYRGLFRRTPWLLLVFPGAWVLLRRPALRREAAVCLALFGGLFLVNLTMNTWEAGRGIGPRYLAAGLPFAALLVLGALRELDTHEALARYRRPLLVGLGLLVAYSIFLMFAATAVQPEVDGAIADPFADHVLPAFFRGDLALNTQSFDSPTAIYTRERIAFNLGHLLGLDGLASLLPLMLCLGGAGTWLGWTLRAAPAANAD